MSANAMMMKRWLIAWCLTLAASAGSHAQESLNVLDGWLAHSDAENALYHHLTRQAHELLSRRSEEVGKINSADAWRKRRLAVRFSILNKIGPFPDRKPLKPEVTGTIERDDFRVENVIYQSRPDFFVTASVFIPKNLDRPAPAILFTSGHTTEGYRAEAYQTMILNLVEKGFVVLAFDPYGQGERADYLQPDGTSRVGGPTRQHSYVGSQMLLAGKSLTSIFVWDAIRSIDYLLTRPEIDPNRIGATGRSGGGTQTAYLAAVDVRIKALVTEAYITSLERLLDSRGPQDAEQNLFHQIKDGINHADLLLARAPEPTMIIATRGDFFNIQGTRESFDELKKAYAAAGAESMIRLAEDNGPHGSTKANREAMYSFFQETLYHPGSSIDEPVELLDAASDLRVTPTGQVATSFDPETPHSLMGRRLADLPEEIPRAGLIERAAEISGFVAPGPVEGLTMTDRIPMDGYVIEKYFVQGEGDYVVPFIALIPPVATRVALVADTAGKPQTTHDLTELEAMVRDRTLVVAMDLPGHGELGPGDLRGDGYLGGVSHNLWYLSMMIGRSLVAVQSGDLLRVLRAVEEDPRARGLPVTGIGRGELAPAMLHAEAFSPFAERLELSGFPKSYREVAETRDYVPSWIMGSVAGALGEYDLPDLVRLVGPERVDWEDR